MKVLIILFIILLSTLVTSKTIEVCSNITIPDQENECNAQLSILTDKESYNNKEKITFYNNLTTKSNFILEYWIESSNGTIIKEKINTTNLNAKSYTPSLKKPDILTIKNKLISIECNNTNNITISEKSIFIYVFQDPNPFLYFQNINPNKTIKLNETIKSKLNIYTGNLTNQTLKIEIQNITSTIQYLNDYETYNLTSLVTIPYDCNIQSKNYQLRLTALNQEITQQISILNTCKVNTTQFRDDNSTNISLLSAPENNINVTENSITGNVVYESSAEKSKKISIYLILAILIMALMYILPSKLITKTTT